MGKFFINYAIVAVLGGLLALNGHTDLGSLASYLVFVRQAALPINQFPQQRNFLLAAHAGAEREFKVMDMEPEIDEGKTDLIRVKKENGVLVPCKEKTGLWAWQKNDGTLVELKGDVRFDHVDFGYDDDRMILKQISLYAKPGQKIAFVGSTGAGKSTIMNLLCRFYDVTEGEVLVDGIDVKNWDLHDLRDNIGMAMQDVFLFSDTIEGNIAYGKPDCTFEEVKEAAVMSDAKLFIKAMPDGYQTIVGERGVGLSGGQKQRISLARALLKKPSILILDDTTSAVDMETESYIQEQLKKLGRKHTVFVIAYRISSIKDADVIFVMDEGRIVERGNHESLLKQNGYYATVYKHQNGMEG